MNLSEKISLILVDKGFSLSPKKNTENLINSGAELHKNKEDIKVEDDDQISALGSMGLIPNIVH